MQDSEYHQLSQKNLQDGEALLREGDHHQASEKFWGAAASKVKAIADQRGWEHRGHRDLYRVISRLVEETGRPELIRLFGSAGHLHTNFYEDWLPPDQVTELADQVRVLLQELDQITTA